MPTISMFYGILIQMYWDEHAPPHFHAIYGEYKAAIDIKNLTILEGSLLDEQRNWFSIGQNSTNKHSSRTGIYAKINSNQSQSRH